MESTIRHSALLRSFLRLVLAGVMAIGLSGCAVPATTTSTPGEWEPMPAEEAGLVLFAPGLGSPRVNFMRKIDGLKIYEFGRWRPEAGAYPEAEIILFRFSPVAPSGMTFVREPTLEERIRQSFGAETIDMGAGGRYENVLGEMEYIRFTRDGANQCVFMRQFGDTYSDQRGYFSDGSMGHGDTMIRGYYCLAPFHELSQITLERFLAGIGLKGFAVPAEPVDLTLTVTPIAAAAASSRRTSASSDAFPYQVTFTSMVFQATGGSQLADDLDEVSLNHGRVFLHVRWRGLTKERHYCQLRVFDGGGNRVKTSGFEFTPTSTRWNTWWSYEIDPDVDQPGTWKFEVDLDGETLVQKTLIVTPSAFGSVRSGTTAVSRDAAFHDYRTFDEASGYKIFVRDEDGAWAWRVRETFHAAQTEAMQACNKRSRERGRPGACRVYAAGDHVVWQMSEKERDKVIKAYKE